MGLPLRMENLHAPTIPSGPTSSSRGANEIRGLTFGQLQARKDSMEAELRALGSVLDSHGVKMDTPLLTPDGFPRADLDIAQIRTTRTRIIHLRNDYKALMAVIETHIHEHFAKQAQNPTLEEPSSNGQYVNTTLRDTPSVHQVLSPRFARVNTVAPGSPADSAGLKTGDEIRNFGYVNNTNHDGLKRVGECVMGNDGRDIMVKVSRAVPDAQQRQELQLTLRPQSWSGRGLLGCHILPI